MTTGGRTRPQPRPQDRARRAGGRAVALPGVLLVAALALTGCSGGRDSSATGSATASGASSPTRTEAATPTITTPSPLPTASRPTGAPPRVATKRRGPQGQKAFARGVMASWSYALRTNNAQPLSNLGINQRCAGCGSLAKTLAQRQKQGWFVDFEGLDVSTISLSSEPIGTQLAKARVTVPRSDSYNDDGSFRNSSPAHRGAVFTVRMRYSSGGYQLVSFSLS